MCPLWRVSFAHTTLRVHSNEALTGGEGKKIFKTGAPPPGGDITLNLAKLVGLDFSKLPSLSNKPIST